MTTEGKVVLVTGATSGIGKATAELLAAKGYRVFGTSRDPAGKAGNGFDLLRLDDTSDESVAACVKAVAERTGRRIDVLYNNAGSLPDSTCNHTFRATGITAYLGNGGTIENAQAIAAHEPPRTTKLYDRTSDEITLDEIERILI